MKSLWIATLTRIRLQLSYVVVKIWPLILGPREKEIKFIIKVMITEKKNCCWKPTCFKENMNSSKKSNYKSLSKMNYFAGIFRQGRPKVALIYFDKACEEVELDPPVPEPYLARSKCFIQLGEVSTVHLCNNPMNQYGVLICVC